MTTKQNTPQIRFKGFSENWIEERLGDVANFSKGSGYSKSDLRSSGHPIILYGRLYTKYQTVIDKVDTFVNENKNSIKSQGNEVIVPASGETAEDIARASAIKQRGVILGGDLNIVELSNAYSSTFTALKISNGQSKSELSKKAQGKSVVHIRNSDLQSLLLDFPNLEEQTAIGNFFQHIDETIALSRSKHKKTKTLKNAFLSKMFPQAGKNQPDIRLKGFSEDWVEKRLEDVVEIVGGGTPDTTNSDFWGGEIDWYSPTEIGKKVYADNSVKTITELGLQKSSAQILPAHKTILFTSRAGIGDMAILRSDAATNQGFQSFIAKDIDVYFLYSMGHLLKEYALEKASGSTFLEISKKQLSVIEILIPSNIEEQTAIGQLFKQLDETLALQAKQLKALENLKKALLAKMFV